jgi:hypothetical protein
MVKTAQDKTWKPINRFFTFCGTDKTLYAMDNESRIWRLTEGDKWDLVPPPDNSHLQGPMDDQ